MSDPPVLPPTRLSEPPPAYSDGDPIGVRSYFLIEGGKVLPCEPELAQIICYNCPGPTEEIEMQDLYNIDYHTLQSSLDPDEISRVEFEPDHCAIIFKRPKSYCADDNFLLKVTSTGVFLYANYAVVVMPDDASLLEGKVPFQTRGLQDLLLRLFYQSIFHFEGHLKAINMLSDSLEKRIVTSLENRYLLNMFALEKSLVYILNSINSNAALFEKLKAASAKLGFDAEQLEILDDIVIENNQCFRRAEIYSQVIASLMDARASIVNNNLNQLIKKFTIWTMAIMLPNLVVGIFSMNVDLPIPMTGHWWPFWFVASMALSSAAFIFWLWRIKRW